MICFLALGFEERGSRPATNPRSGFVSRINTPATLDGPASFRARLDTSGLCAEAEPPRVLLPEALGSSCVTSSRAGFVPVADSVGSGGGTLISGTTPDSRSRVSAHLPQLVMLAHREVRRGRSAPNRRWSRHEVGTCRQLEMLPLVMFGPHIVLVLVLHLSQMPRNEFRLASWAPMLDCARDACGLQPASVRVRNWLLNGARWARCYHWCRARSTVHAMGGRQSHLCAALMCPRRQWWQHSRQAELQLIVSGYSRGTIHTTRTRHQPHSNGVQEVFVTRDLYDQVNFRGHPQYHNPVHSPSLLCSTQSVSSAYSASLVTPVPFLMTSAKDSPCRFSPTSVLCMFSVELPQLN